MAVDENRSLDTGGGRAWQQSRRDMSAALRASECGVVDNVILTTDADGYRFVKASVVLCRVPCEGEAMRF